jgi:hypothetical protein
VILFEALKACVGILFVREISAHAVWCKQTGSKMNIASAVKLGKKRDFSFRHVTCKIIYYYICDSAFFPPFCPSLVSILYQALATLGVLGVSEWQPQHNLVTYATHSHNLIKQIQAVD